jgi:hypothetical protein
MSRASQKFTQSDVVKTIKGAQKAGLQVQSVELDWVTGKLVVVAACSPPATTDTVINAEVEKWDLVK